MKNDLEQYFLIDTKEYGQLLDRLDFGNLRIIEIGVGNGTLTELLARNIGYEKIVGYEIDPAVIPAHLARSIELHVGDVRHANFAYLNPRDFGLVSNPPYKLLPWIYKRLVEPHPAMPVILMLPEKLATSSRFAGFKRQLLIPGSGFAPPTSGSHVVVSRGFQLKP